MFEREPGGDFARRPLIASRRTPATPRSCCATTAPRSSPGARRPRSAAMVRSGPGAFGPPVSFAEPARAAARPRPVPSASGLVTADPAIRPYEGQHAPRAAARRRRPRAARLGHRRTAACGRRPSPPPGCPSVRRWRASVRDPAGVTPLVLADGRRAVAWTDNAAIFSVPPVRRPAAPRARGRSAPPRRRRPELEVGAPRDRSLRPAQSLVLPVRCSAACDLRGDAGRRPDLRPGGLARRARARRCCGSGRSSMPVAPRRPGPVRVVVRWSAPGSSSGALGARSTCGCGACRRRGCRGSWTCARAGCPAGGSRCAGARTARPIDAVWSSDGRPGRRSEARERLRRQRRRAPPATGAAIASSSRTPERVRHVLVTLSARFGSRGRKVVRAGSVTRSLGNAGRPAPGNASAHERTFRRPGADRGAAPRSRRPRGRGPEGPRRTRSLRAAGDRPPRRLGLPARAHAGLVPARDRHGRRLHRARPRLDQGRRARRPPRERDLGHDRRRRAPEFAAAAHDQDDRRRRRSRAGSPRTSRSPSSRRCARRSGIPQLRPRTSPSTASTRCRRCRRSSTSPSARASGSTPRPSTRPTSTRSSSRSRSRWSGRCARTGSTAATPTSSCSPSRSPTCRSSRAS